MDPGELGRDEKPSTHMPQFTILRCDTRRGLICSRSIVLEAAGSSAGAAGPTRRARAPPSAGAARIAMQSHEYFVDSRTRHDA